MSKIIDEIDELLGILSEESPDERAEMRFNSFQKKAGGDKGKLSRQLNLRTSRTTKKEKLQAWIKVLSSRGMKDEAQNAKDRLKSL